MKKEEEERRRRPAAVMPRARTGRSQRFTPAL
jgi:hypothetical protein